MLDPNTFFRLTHTKKVEIPQKIVPKKQMSSFELQKLNKRLLSPKSYR